MIGQCTPTISAPNTDKTDGIPFCEPAAMHDYTALKQFLESPPPTVIADFAELLHPHTPPDMPDWPIPQTAKAIKQIAIRLQPDTRGQLVSVALAMGDLMVVAYAASAPDTIVAAIMECLTNNRFSAELPLPVAEKWWCRCRCRLAVAAIENCIIDDS